MADDSRPTPDGAPAEQDMRAAGDELAELLGMALTRANPFDVGSVRASEALRRWRSLAPSRREPGEQDGRLPAEVDQVFLRQVASVVRVSTSGEQWQHEVLFRVGELARASVGVSDPGSDPDECGHIDMLARIADAAGTEIGPQFMTDVMPVISYGRLWYEIRRAWPGPVGALHRAHVEGQDCPFPDPDSDEPPAPDYRDVTWLDDLLDEWKMSGQKYVPLLAVRGQLRRCPRLDVGDRPVPDPGSDEPHARLRALADRWTPNTLGVPNSARRRARAECADDLRRALAGRCCDECSEQHTYEPGVCEAALPPPPITRSVPGQQPAPGNSGAVAEIRHEIATQLSGLTGYDSGSSLAMRRTLVWAQGMVERVAREHAVPSPEVADAREQIGRYLVRQRAYVAKQPQKAREALEWALGEVTRLRSELARAWEIAGGGRCTTCGEVAALTRDGLLVEHTTPDGEAVCDGGGTREYEPPALAVRVDRDGDPQDIASPEVIEALARHLHETSDARIAWSYDEMTNIYRYRMRHRAQNVLAVIHQARGAPRTPQPAPDQRTERAAQRIARLAAGDVVTPDDRDAIVRVVAELDDRWAGDEPDDDHDGGATP